MRDESRYFRFWNDLTLSRLETAPTKDRWSLYGFAAHIVITEKKTPLTFILPPRHKDGRGEED